MNDFQNAYDTGKMIRFHQQVERNSEITAVLNAGRFALVGIGPVHCPFTDAVTGSSRHLISAHDTRAEADQAADQLYADCPGEIDFQVLPALPQPVRAATIEDDGIPF